MVEKMDKLGLRFNHQAVVETPKEVLKISESVIVLKDKFIVAKTAPTIEFCIIPIPNHERCQLDPPPSFILRYGRVGDKVIFRNLLKLIMPLLGIIVFLKPVFILQNIMQIQKQLI